MLMKFMLLALLATGLIYNSAAMETTPVQRTVEAVKPPEEEKALKTGTPASKASKSINVMTFNILWDKVTKGPTQWTFRKQGMVNLIKRHHPDIVGIQEGFIGQMEYISSEVKYAYFGWGTDDGKSDLDSPGKRQSLNPIMYDQKRLKVLEKGVFWYADQAEVPGIFAGADKHFRNCVWGKFKELGSKGKTFYVFNTHFSLKDDMRQKQVMMLKSKIREIAGESIEVIVTGDFNSDALRDTSYNLLIDPHKEMTLVDSKKICSSPASGPSFSGSGLRVNSRTKGTEIDHIFVRNIKSSTAYKVIEDYEGDVYPSDHFPVLAVLKFDR
ncbi:endonuclease/exonuclease/phosphatase family protein [Pedobacter heparinus]|uniref:endonuclease/exonuclease/phosphatase family protein n=1 Tax=Pedobacter heparinus TaxID=984 RepID=UPI00292E6525|nr:endonuclease/exonuclease/phosphatase family protein [Pedobacter heparinus]